MDGTFIPLQGNRENRRDLARLCEELRQRELDLVYVTGRHYELALDAIDSHQLPSPCWMICDVGTSIYHRGTAGTYESLPAYTSNLAQRIGRFDVTAVAELVGSVAGLRIQEPEKQGPFKLSYYCDATRLSDISVRLMQLLREAGAPYRITPSVDPFTATGLIDLLPQGVSKAYALDWWVEHTGYSQDMVIFAGDSGNDIAALTAGYRSIVVGNADREIVELTRRVHTDSGWTDRLFLATKPATSGVLEGVQHFMADH